VLKIFEHGIKKIISEELFWKITFFFFLFFCLSPFGMPEAGGD